MVFYVFLCCSVCWILNGQFCHGALKLAISTLFTTFFLWTSLQFIFSFFIYNFLSDFSKTCWVPALVRSMNFIGGNQHIARQTCTNIFEEEKRTFSPISVASPAGRISRSLVKAHESMMVLYWSGSNSRPNRILSRSVAFCIHACWATYAVEPYIENILYVEL